MVEEEFKQFLKVQINCSCSLKYYFEISAISSIHIFVPCFKLKLAVTRKCFPDFSLLFNFDLCLIISAVDLDSMGSLDPYPDPEGQK
jgi:hypothetical protein